MGNSRSLKTNSDKLYLGFVNLILVFSLIVIVIPVIYILSSSFSSPEAVMGGKVLFLPVGFGFRGYKEVFSKPEILRGFGNSAMYAFLGTILSTILTILAAYPLSRKDLKARNFVMLIFTITMLFNGGLIPFFIVVKKLGMVDTIFSMFVPNAVSVFNIIVARTYIQTSIPEELYESASLEGCKDFKYLTKFVIPLSKPIIAVIVLWVAIAQWNSFFYALIFLYNAKLQPLQMILRDLIVIQSTMEAALNPKKFAEKNLMRNLVQHSMIVVATVPMMLLYPIAQKYFTKGIMIGAIKG